jgi:hypothetical protein
LLGAEAQQRRYVSDLVELGVVFNVKEFYITADHPGQDGFGHVDDLASFTAADWTKANQVGIEVAAAGALYGLGMIIFSDEQGLHFA